MSSITVVFHLKSKQMQRISKKKRFKIEIFFQPPRYEDIGEEVLESLDDEKVQKIPVKPIKYPDLTYLKTFEKGRQFSPFIKGDMKYAKALMKVFDSAKDLDELISLSLYCRDQLNKQLFVYAYSVVITARYDSDNIQVPQPFELEPTKFFSKSTLVKVKQACHEHEEFKRTKRYADPNASVPAGVC